MTHRQPSPSASDCDPQTSSKTVNGAGEAEGPNLVPTTGRRFPADNCRSSRRNGNHCQSRQPSPRDGPRIALSASTPAASPVYAPSRYTVATAPSPTYPVAGRASPNRSSATSSAALTAWKCRRDGRGLPVLDHRRRTGPAVILAGRSSDGSDVWFPADRARGRFDARQYSYR